MKRPRTYHIYKKDPVYHQYHYTYEAHQECKAFKRYLNSIKDMRLIVSNKEIEKVFKKIKNHCRNLKEQPVTIDFIGKESDESKVIITSVEGKVEFELFAEKRELD